MTKASSILIFTLVLDLAPALAPAQECHIKIGALFPMTGPAALIGDRAQQATRLSLADLPDALRERITVDFEDTEMKAAAGFRATQNLLMDPEVVGLTGFGSETIAASAATIEAKHVPGIFITPDRKPLVGKHFLFRHWVDGADMLDSIMPELKRRDIKKISVIYSEIPAMSEFGDHLLRSAEGLGLKVGYHTNVLPSENDFHSIARAALTGEPDAIFFFFLAPQPSIFMKQLRSLNQSIPVFTYVNVENSHEVEAAQGTLEKVIYAGPVFTDEFVRKFSERYKEYPEFASGNAYDIIQIYAQGLASGACTAETMRNYIAGLKEFHGALGSYGVTGGNDFRFPVRPKTIQGGKFKFL